MLQAHLCIAQTQSQWMGKGCAHSTHRARSEKDQKSLPTRLWMLHLSSTFIILASHGFRKWERVSSQIFLMRSVWLWLNYCCHCYHGHHLALILILDQKKKKRKKRRSQNCKKVNWHANFHNKIILFQILKLHCSSCFPDVLYINMNVDADVQEDIYTVYVQNKFIENNFIKS